MADAAPQQADIVLATLNARYAHCAFGLRYLLANLGDLQPRARMLEFEIRQPADAVAAAILACAPCIVGLGVYIWNVAPLTRVVRALRAARPDLLIVLGGPEVSYEADGQEICALADHVIAGEADAAFPALCRRLLAGERPAERLLQPPPVAVRPLALPYDLYTDEDIAHRVIYVEASRGCPFTCEFCLSSLDSPVRRFPLETLLPAFDRLLARGVRQFKFVDRTFNLSIPWGVRIMEFFLERHRPGLFLHLEMIPDRLPDELRDLIRAFPPGALQFEVGIQTFNEEVAALIRRRQDYAKTEENLRFLRRETGAYLHADLIYGLPGESLESFAAGFDRLVALGPHEIQVNQLKRLRGTPIVRHDAEWGVRWETAPPYEIVENRLIPAAEMQRLRRFARAWDLVANSGNFLETAPLIGRGPSPFAAFGAFAESLHARFGRVHAIALADLAEAVFDHLRGRGHELAALAAMLARDYRRGARRDLPVFLRPWLPGEPRWRENVEASPGLARQARRGA